MRREHLLWLAAATFLVLFLAFVPLLSFVVWGSDTGEYYVLTQSIVTTGRLPAPGTYTGWGTAYPDFPGIFLLAAAAAGALGLPTMAALTGVIPAVSVLSILPLYLLFRRLFPNDTVAILGAAFATVALPRMVSISHPAPLALGDFLVVAALWMFVEGRRDARWYLPLGITAGTLIVTHHLSSYFFLLSALGGLLLFELWRPGLWSRRAPLRELLFLGLFGLGLVAFWTLYATDFRVVVLQFGLPGIPPDAIPGVLAAGVVLGVVIAGLLIRLRRAHPGKPRVWVRLPSAYSVARDAGLIAALLVGGVTLLFLAPLPGTGQMATLFAVAYFAPILVLALFASGARSYLTFNRVGLFAIAWLGILSISVLIAAVWQNPILQPERHAEYLVIPLGLVAALGLARLVVLWGDRSGRKAIVAGSVVILALLAANAAVAYPPPAAFDGFQEGYTSGDAALWMWVGIGLPPNASVASDHRLSSMIFGTSGNPATWDTTPALFIGTDRSAMLAELNGSLVHGTTPSGEVRPINAVVVDGTMRTEGVALSPSAYAVPMSPEAQQWLTEPPFVTLYEQGPQAVYWVTFPAT